MFPGSAPRQRESGWHRKVLAFPRDSKRTGLVHILRPHPTSGMGSRSDSTLSFDPRTRFFLQGVENSKAELAVWGVEAS